MTAIPGVYFIEQFIVDGVCRITDPGGEGFACVEIDQRVMMLEYTDGAIERCLVTFHIPYYDPGIVLKPPL